MAAAVRLAHVVPHLRCRSCKHAARRSEQRPELYCQKDGRVWRDGNLFRALVLHNHGGVYVDMDMVLLRSLGALLDRDFIYQWDDFDDHYNGALMHLARGSRFARELLVEHIEIAPGETV